MNILRRHYPEYLMEAACLAIFMLAASLMTVLLEYPPSQVRQAISDPLLRRLIIGITMGMTAIAIIYSPWGKQSGAHINPVITLTFFRLGKIEPFDALFYIVAQCIGGLLGVLIAAKLVKDAIAHPSVNYAVTIPGSTGIGTAFLAELLISFGLMLMVLITSNHPKLSRFTGIFAGVLVAIYIAIEAPFSGMSMNPARTLASAIPAQNWTAIWIYFTAPLLGMLLAAELYVRLNGRNAVRCAKLHHHNSKRCIFRCGYRSQWPGNEPLPHDLLTLD
ncbi:MIP/aquaporin family protein [Phormidesmis sp. 146-12]